MDGRDRTSRRTFVTGLAAGLAATTLGTSATALAGAETADYTTERLRIPSWDGTSDDTVVVGTDQP